MSPPVQTVVPVSPTVQTVVPVSPPVQTVSDSLPPPPQLTPAPVPVSVAAEVSELFLTFYYLNSLNLF